MEVRLNKVCIAKLATYLLLGSVAASSAYGKTPQPPRVLNHGDWVTSDDYPHEGVEISHPVSVDFRLAINGKGLAEKCMIMRGSGSKVLDEWTCNLVMSRARFKPAKDENGKVTQGSYFETVKWLPRK